MPTKRNKTIVWEPDEQLLQIQSIVMDIARRILGTGLKHIEYSVKDDRSLVTRYDHDLQTELLKELNAAWPGFTALAEETPVQKRQELSITTEQSLWIIDPLDGTTNFVAGLPCFGLSVAQMIQGSVERAVVYDPVHDECFSAVSGKGAYLNGTLLQPRYTPERLDDALALVDSKRLPSELARRVAAEPPFRSQRNFGAAALEWCWLAAGRGDVYLHGKQQIWDYAAGQLIFCEAGGRAVDLNGECISTATLGPSSVVAARHPDIFEQWCKWLGIESPATC